MVFLREVGKRQTWRFRSRSPSRRATSRGRLEVTAQTPPPAPRGSKGVDCWHNLATRGSDVLSSLPLSTSWATDSGDPLRRGCVRPSIPFAGLLTTLDAVGALRPPAAGPDPSTRAPVSLARAIRWPFRGCGRTPPRPGHAAVCRNLTFTARQARHKPRGPLVLGSPSAEVRGPLLSPGILVPTPSHRCLRGASRPSSFEVMKIWTPGSM